MNNPISIVHYTPDRKHDWDNFVERSKNGTFLFKRDYMEYHADRFEDCSFLFLREHKICALLPGCVKGELYTSHAGLTYGGFILSEKAATIDLLEMIQIWLKHLIEKGIQRVIYKCVPHIYHKLPAEEDLYALFRVKARLVRRDISTTILPQKTTYNRLRSRKIKQAKELGITVREGENWAAFWEILTQNLKMRYDTSPTHSLEEIIHLNKLFPQNILFYEVIQQEAIIGGGVVYLTETCAHLQYAHASPEGKESGAIDLLVDHLLNEVYPNIPYFDFGISTESNGTVLNENLIFMKEGFGGRAIAYDQYKIDLSHPNNLVNE